MVPDQNGHFNSKVVIVFDSMSGFLYYSNCVNNPICSIDVWAYDEVAPAMKMILNSSYLCLVLYLSMSQSKNVIIR